MERIDVDRYYLDFGDKSVFHRFGLWAPARTPEGEHRFALVEVPDGYANMTRLAGEVSRLQDENPGANIFVAGWADQKPEHGGVDWWPLGIITPKDFSIAFRFRNGLHNPDSRQAQRYINARRRFLGK